MLGELYISNLTLVGGPNVTGTLVKPLFTQLTVVFTQLGQHLWRAGVYTC